MENNIKTSKSHMIMLDYYLNNKRITLAEAARIVPSVLEVRKRDRGHISRGGWSVYPLDDNRDGNGDALFVVSAERK